MAIVVFAFMTALALLVLFVVVAAVRRGGTRRADTGGDFAWLSDGGASFTGSGADCSSSDGGGSCDGGGGGH